MTVSSLHVSIRVTLAKLPAVEAVVKRPHGLLVLSLSLSLFLSLSFSFSLSLSLCLSLCLSLYLSNKHIRRSGVESTDPKQVYSES